MLIIKSPREAFATPVQAVSGIVGKQRQTLPILSNILISKVGTRVDFTATDLDIEIKTFAEVAKHKIIEMNVKNDTGYDQLHPKTNVNIVEGAAPKSVGATATATSAGWTGTAAPFT